MPRTPPAIPSTAPKRLAGHAEMVALLDGDLTAERAALHEAIIDTLSDRDDDGTPRWSYEQILEAEPLVGGQRQPSEPPRRPSQRSPDIYSNAPTSTNSCTTASSRSPTA
jgi:hypothetical protein